MIYHYKLAMSEEADIPVEDAGGPAEEANGPVKEADGPAEGTFLPLLATLAADCPESNFTTGQVEASSQFISHTMDCSVREETLVIEQQQITISQLRREIHTLLSQDKIAEIAETARQLR